MLGPRNSRIGSLATALALLNLHSLPLPGQGEPHHFREVHLGLEITISIQADRPAAERSAAAAFARIAELEQILSDWRPSSELRRLTATPGRDWRPVSPALGAVLAQALEVAAASDGAFDPTIGALTVLWREQRRTGHAPDPGALAAARATVDWRAIELDTAAHRVRFRHDGIRLDLGGIAKGWILDRALDVLRQHGTPHAMIEAGGDLVAGAAPLGSDGWRIAIRTTSGDSIIVIHDGALATSGPSAQSIIDEHGVVRSHVIDPASGLGLSNGVEVTVRARSGARADALATTFTLVSGAAWPRLLQRFQVELVAAPRN